MNDNVNSPLHYQRGGLECIDVIRAELGIGFIDYCYGNAIKYLWRWREKNGIEDLKKCHKYIEWMIESTEKIDEGFDIVHQWTNGQGDQRR